MKVKVTSNLSYRLRLFGVLKLKSLVTTTLEFKSILKSLEYQVLKSLATFNKLNKWPIYKYIKGGL